MIFSDIWALEGSVKACIPCISYFCSRAMNTLVAQNLTLPCSDSHWQDCTGMGTRRANSSPRSATSSVWSSSSFIVTLKLDQVNTKILLCLKCCLLLAYPLHLKPRGRSWGSLLRFSGHTVNDSWESCQSQSQIQNLMLGLNSWPKPHTICRMMLPFIYLLLGARLCPSLTKELRVWP